MFQFMWAMLWGFLWWLWSPGHSGLHLFGGQQGFSVAFCFHFFIVQPTSLLCRVSCCWISSFSCVMRPWAWCKFCKGLEAVVFRFRLFAPVGLCSAHLVLVELANWMRRSLGSLDTCCSYIFCHVRLLFVQWHFGCSDLIHWIAVY